MGIIPVQRTTLCTKNQEPDAKNTRNARGILPGDSSNLLEAPRARAISPRRCEASTVRGRDGEVVVVETARQ